MLHYVEKNGELVTDVMSKCINSHVRLLLFEIKQSLFKFFLLFQFLFEYEWLISNKIFFFINNNFT